MLLFSFSFLSALHLCLLLYHFTLSPPPPHLSSFSFSFSSSSSTSSSTSYSSSSFSPPPPPSPPSPPPPPAVECRRDGFLFRRPDLLVDALLAPIGSRRRRQTPPTLRQLCLRRSRMADDQLRMLPRLRTALSTQVLPHETCFVIKSGVQNMC